MACRVGMSTTPEQRINHWKRVEGHTNGEVLVRGLTYDQAKAREQQEAYNRGCRQSEGGPRNGLANWAVYHVWGGR